MDSNAKEFAMHKCERLRPKLNLIIVLLFHYSSSVIIIRADKSHVIDVRVKQSNLRIPSTFMCFTESALSEITPCYYFTFNYGQSIID